MGSKQLPSNATNLFLRLILSTFFYALLFASSSALFSSAAYAQNASPIPLMAQLNATGRALEAYRIGLQFLPALEGEPIFDLHFGVAAIDSGFASQGAFALERVLMNEPTNDYARLELGRAYFILEEDDRAKAEFESVLNADPPPPEDVTNNIRPYLSAIDSRAAWRETTFIANVELGSGYDSNILAAPDDDLFFIPLLGGEASLGGTEESDTFHQLKLDAMISHPVRYGLNLFLSGNALKRDNHSDQINIESLGVQSGVIYRNGDHTVRAAIQANALDVDSDAYRDTVGLSASWQYSLSPRASINAFGQVNQLSYELLEFRDATLRLFGLSYRYQFIAPLRPVVSFGINAGKEDADNDDLSGALQNTERDILGATASLDLTINNELRVSGVLGYEQSDYATEELLFQTIREDKMYRGSLGVVWTPTDNLFIKLDASVSPRRSNIPIVEYDRNQFTLSVRYRYR